MIILYLLVSLGASLVGAVSGIGGGVIIKPVLDSIGSFDVTVIGFLSGCTVLSMTVVTLFRNRKAALELNRQVTMLLAIGGVAGGLIGKYLFDIIRSGSTDDRFVGASQSLILTLMTIGVLFFTIYKERIRPQHHDGAVFTLSAGLTLGALAAFLGIGGGPINLAVLYFFFSMNSKKAALSSIFIIFFSQFTSLVFTITSGKVPDFDPLILSVMIAGGISGGLIGSHVTKKLSHRGVDILFSFVLVGIIGICLYNFVNWVR